MNSPSNDNGAKGGAQRCPICKSHAATNYAPFCSKRCADVDLHRWLSGHYAIPASEDDSDDAPADSREGE